MTALNYADVNGAEIKANDNNATFENGNGIPLKQDQSTMHVAVRRGEVANRILSVGSYSRAQQIAEHLDSTSRVLKIASSRGFTVFTGKYEGVLVSIIATGMGVANIDFVIRETREVVDGPMTIIRFGTCGILKPDIPVGSLCLPSLGSVYVYRNPDAFFDDSTANPYHISDRPVFPNEALTNALKENLTIEFKNDSVHDTMNVSCCSFYSSEGRDDPSFDDKNDHIIEQLLEKHPSCGSMEMETFHLFDLARCCRENISVSAVMIGLINREGDSVLDTKTYREIETRGGKAILHTLVQF